MAGVVGVLLAAGQGRRMGRPKALVDNWLVRAVEVLRAGGCDHVVVVLGAEADQATALLADAGLLVEGTDGAAPLTVRVAADWATGMGASLRAGLEAATTGDAAAALVTLVDLPDIGPDVVARLLAPGIGPETLRRAGYADGPGHPVLLGRAHWAGIADTAAGDRGARDYLAARPVEVVDCRDLASGRDVDAPSGIRANLGPTGPA